MHFAGDERGGYTLVELLVTVSIIVIATGMLLPALTGARATARQATTVGMTNTVATAMTQFRQMNGRMPGVFSQEELAGEDNVSGFTSMQNALLDLAGGVVPATGLAGADSFDLTIAGRTIRISPQMMGAAGGPGYLPLPIQRREGSGLLANSIAPAQIGTHKVVDLARAQGSGGEMSDLPDVLDSWGRPILLWVKNDSAGLRPLFAALRAPTTSSDRQARFYWWTNRGYLAAPTQARRSAIGSEIPSTRRIRSLEAALGDPAAPDPQSGSQSEGFVPLTGRGEFVLHAAGRDGLFMTNGGDTNTAYRYVPGGTPLLDASVGLGGDRHPWLSVKGLDDVIKGWN